MRVTDEDYERICEAAGMMDFIDGSPVFPTVPDLVREVEYARAALDNNNNYWIGRTGPAQCDLDSQAARGRWLQRSWHPTPGHEGGEHVPRPLEGRRT
jgi:hypothetical protein